MNSQLISLIDKDEESALDITARARAVALPSQAIKAWLKNRHMRYLRNARDASTIGRDDGGAAMQLSKADAVAVLYQDLYGEQNG